MVRPKRWRHCALSIRGGADRYPLPRTSGRGAGRRRQSAIEAIQRLDLRSNGIGVPGIVDHVVGGGEPLFTTYLRGHNGADLGGGKPATRDDPSNLLGFGTVDDEYPMSERTQTRALEQEGDDDDPVGIVPAFDLARDLGRDQGVQQAFQTGARLSIGKHQPAQRGAIELAVWPEQVTAKLRHDGGETGLAGCGQLVRKRVGVDDRDAECDECGCDERLATADTAGQADDVSQVVPGR